MLYDLNSFDKNEKRSNFVLGYKTSQNLINDIDNYSKSNLFNDEKFYPFSRYFICFS